MPGKGPPRNRVIRRDVGFRTVGLEQRGYGTVILIPQ
jgi:hypothetical protein